MPLTIFQTIEYAGYKRRIVSRNPLAFDQDGDIVDDDDDAEDVDPELMDDNPYDGIRLEG
jgi:hypothetical protein